jgi:threonine dehydratase
MGSGISGLIAVRDLLGLFTEIIAVGAARAPATALSFAAGHVIAAPSAQTFADGLATREPHVDAIATICRGAARMVEVSEDAIAEAIRIYYDDTKHVAEGAGAAPLAGLLEERARMAGKSVAVVLSGGNIERARFQRILGGETPSAN